MALASTTEPVTLANSTIPEIRLLRKALGIRLFEQRLLKLFSEGRLFGTVHTCIGQEWTGVAVAEHLQPADVIFSNHRCHGHYLARTGNFEGLFAEIMGREAGICAGRGGSQHICDSNVFSNGIQGGIMPVSAGIAYAQKIEDGNAITVVFIGDGTLGEGAVYETLNIASMWGLPLLVILENNLYAQSTSQKQTLSGDILARPQAFGIATMHGNTWEPTSLIASVGKAVEQVRETRQPLFFRIDTYRLMAHSKSDDDRSRDEVEGYWQRDVLHSARETHREVMEPLTAELEQMLDDAVAQAEKSPLSSELETSLPEPATTWSETLIEEKDRVVNRIYAGLRSAMEQDERVILLGEDIEGPYGGAFKVTKDLSQIFPGRVRNTPISELAITGVSNGLALRGMHPVTEIMFGDFVMLAADQWINHAAKFQYMYANQVTVPLVLRTPMGGKRGYGPTHSQSLEKHLLGVPGTQVLALHNRYDPALIYGSLMKDIDRPTLVIENKVLYGEKASSEAIDGYKWFHSSHRFPISYLHTETPSDLVILCMGGMLSEVEKAIGQLFLEHDIIAEALCPTQIFPLQIEAILSIVRQSGRLLLVEEGHGFCGFTAEVLAEIYERDPNVRIRRVYSHSQHIPSAKPLELEVLPNAARIVREALVLGADR
ncbi:dehydrogenase E1 protein subunits alpha/beta [Edaphobacter dinghuensis]|uniref:Dehydrogenase E1 protein subunits alpha/beta n=1 Tax=Edaphobacter dinghuensis TaxID=1560005 RepID=A0A917H792_9BACT|nr:dehydrogenase E1 protein subunits alpha/beta [Edaphobacter dinghuensis]